MTTKPKLLTLSSVLMLSAPVAQATPADDAYITGYAAATLKQQLKLDLPALTVKDGIISLPAANLSATQRSEATRVLTEIMA